MKKQTPAQLRRQLEAEGMDPVLAASWSKGSTKAKRRVQVAGEVFAALRAIKAKEQQRRQQSATLNPEPSA